MKIILNNREEELTGESLTVAEMLMQKKFTYRMRIVKVNGVFIPKDQYDSAVIKDGDTVHMLYLMSGG